MRKFNIRYYYTAAYYKFRLALSNTFIQVKSELMKFKININQLINLNFTKFYFKVQSLYYYSKGFSQLSRFYNLKENYSKFLITDYNIKQKDARLKVLTIGLVFYRIIRTYRAHLNSHYLGSFDLLLTTVTCSDFARFGASFLSTYLNLQLQKIPNKKMQQWFIGACNEFFRGLLEVGKHFILKKLQFITMKGIQFDVKGRAADLRRVFVRRKKYGHTYNTKHGYFDVSKSYCFDFFTTKWGSTSVRVSYFFDNFYQSRSSNSLASL